MIYRKLLVENRILAGRKASPEEIHDITEKAKLCIEDQQFKIVDRDKNDKWLDKQGVNISDTYAVMSFVYKYLTDDNFIAILNDDDRPGEELYVYRAPQKSDKVGYLKFGFRNGEMRIISLHDMQFLNKYCVDYSEVPGMEGDTFFMDAFANRWKKYLNKYYKIDCNVTKVTDKSFTLEFEDAVPENIKGMLLKTRPRDVHCYANIIPFKKAVKVELQFPKSYK